MKKTIISLVSLLLFSLSAYSQDDIVVTTVKKTQIARQDDTKPDTIEKSEINYRDTSTYIAEMNEVSQQEDEKLQMVAMGTDGLSLGLGMGLDYGGFGSSILFYPQSNVGFFGSIGYNLVGVGYNVGTKLRLLPKNPGALISAHALVMYGYNTVIKVTDASGLDKAFNGATFGLGLDMRFSPLNRGYMTVSVLLPLRDPKVQEYIDQNSLIIENGLTPVTISIGVRIVIK